MNGNFKNLGNCLFTFFKAHLEKLYIIINVNQLNFPCITEFVLLFLTSTMRSCVASPNSTVPIN